MLPPPLLLLVLLPSLDLSVGIEIALSVDVDDDGCCWWCCCCCCCCEKVSGIGATLADEEDEKDRTREVDTVLSDPTPGDQVSVGLSLSSPSSSSLSRSATFASASALAPPLVRRFAASWSRRRVSSFLHRGKQVLV